MGSLRLDGRAVKVSMESGLEDRNNQFEQGIKQTQASLSQWSPA